MGLCRHGLHQWAQTRLLGIFLCPQSMPCPQSVFTGIEGVWGSSQDSEALLFVYYFIIFYFKKIILCSFYYFCCIIFLLCIIILKLIQNLFVKITIRPSFCLSPPSCVCTPCLMAQYPGEEGMLPAQLSGDGRGPEIVGGEGVAGMSVGWGRASRGMWGWLGLLPLDQGVHASFGRPK